MSNNTRTRKPAAAKAAPKRELSKLFATPNMTAEQVDDLISQGLEHTSADGIVDYSKIQTTIGYNRGWLIVRRAWLELNQPGVLVTLPAAGPDRDSTNRAWSKVITPMRDEQKLSWGEISVRTGTPESKVRACYRATGNKKDVGLRIGKGGRFAYGEPEFYLGHRQAEGAMIPAELRSKPTVEQLLNANDPVTGELVAAARAKVQARRAEKAAERKAS